MVVPSKGKTGSLVNMRLFEQEAIILKGLRHSAIPRVYDYFMDQGTFYIVEEYIEGESMSNLMHKHTFSQMEALDFAIQIADCLQYLHRCKPPIIFRDLKPANIKVFEGKVFIIDFSGALLPGIGKETEDALIYSKGYTPPDFFKSGRIDFTFDTYSLGVVLFEMLTLYDVKSSSGKLPSIEKLRQGISPEVREILNRAVYPKHYLRYQTMWEMKMEMENARSSLQRLSLLEERREKNPFVSVLICIHKFRISLLQPLLAFFLFILIGITICFPFMFNYIKPGINYGIIGNPNFLYVLALYMLFIQIIWGRWFGGIPFMSRIYRRLHKPVAFLFEIRIISLLLTFNVFLLVMLNIYFIFVAFIKTK